MLLQFQNASIDKLREIQPQLKVLAWFSSQCASFMSMYGPPELGGELETLEQGRTAAKALGREDDWQQLWLESYTHGDSTLKKFPGCEPMFQYEVQPSNLPVMPLIPV